MPSTRSELLDFSDGFSARTAVRSRSSGEARPSPSPPWSIHKPRHRRRRSTCDHPSVSRCRRATSHPKLLLLLSSLLPIPHSALLISGPRQSVPLHPTTVTSPCRSAGGRYTGRRCYPPSPPPSGAGCSPSGRRRQRPAGAPADSPSELKVRPPQIPPPTEIGMG